MGSARESSFGQRRDVTRPGRVWRLRRTPDRVRAMAAAAVLTAGLLPLTAVPVEALAAACPPGTVVSGENCIAVLPLSGTWIVPTGITAVRLLVVGGGGGGGTAFIDAGTSKRFGGGGGGGGGVTFTSASVTPGDTWTATIGAGGAAGSAGGLTTFTSGGTTISAAGGGAGGNATSSGPGAGGDSAADLSPASTVTFTGGNGITVGTEGGGGGGAGAGQEAQGNSAKVGGWVVANVVTAGRLNAANWASGAYAGVGAGYGGNGFRPTTTGTAFDFYYYYGGSYYVQAYGPGGAGGMAANNTAPVARGGSSYDNSTALYPDPAGYSGHSSSSSALAEMNGTDGSGGGGGGGGSLGATAGDAQTGGVGGSGLVAIAFRKLAAGLSTLAGFDTLADYTAWEASGSYTELDLSPALSNTTDAYEIYAPSATSDVWLGLTPLTDNTISSVTAPGATVNLLRSGAKIEGITVGSTVVTVVVDSAGSLVQETYTIAIFAPPAPPEPGSRALAWGYGGDGALGDGGTTDRARPVQVAFGANTSGQWLKVASGYDSSCGVSSNSLTYCWGNNDYGQLGDGGSTTSNSPVLTSSGANTASTWSNVSVGSYFACGVATDAKGYCWGYNGYETLGDGTSTDSATPVLLAAHSTNWTTIAAADHHVCGLKTAGSIYCWGDGSYGELGDSATSTQPAPTAVVNGANTSGLWKAIATGYYHSCGVSQAGRAYCWGYNSSGELGDNTTTDQSSPVAVQAGANSAGTWSSITAGYYFSCGISTNHKAYCWGNNDYGSFGDGTDTSSNTPVQVLVPGSQKVVHLSANFYSGRVCALTDAPKLYCWGDNGYGEIGDGTTTASLTPVEVSLLGVLSGGTPLSVATGSYTTLLIARFPVVPAAPSISRAVPTDGGAKVFFTAGADGTSPTTNYEYQIDGGAWVAFSPSATTSPVMITGLTNGTTYSIKIRAVSAEGNSTASNAKSVTPGGVPGAPVITSIKQVDRGAKVTFTVGAAGTSPTTNYEYQLDGGSWVALSPAVTTSPLTITGLSNGTTYSIRIRAVRADGVGAASNAKTVTPGGTPSPTPDPVPTELKPGKGQILIDGKPVKVTVTVNASRTRVTLTGPNGLAMTLAGQGSDGSPVPIAADGALLLVREGEAMVSGTGIKPNSLVKLYMMSTPQLIGTTTVNGKGSFKGSAIIPKRKIVGDHVIQAVGLTASGKQYHLSLAVRVVKKDTKVPPTAVRNLAVARLIETHQAQVTWSSPSSTGGASLSGYVVSYRTTGMTGWHTLATPTKRTYTMSGLVSGCRYDVRVSAANSAGQGPWDSVSVTMSSPGRFRPFGDVSCRIH